LLGLQTSQLATAARFIPIDQDLTPTNNAKQFHHQYACTIEVTRTGRKRTVNFPQGVRVGAKKLDVGDATRVRTSCGWPRPEDRRLKLTTYRRDDRSRPGVVIQSGGQSALGSNLVSRHRAL